MPVSVKIMCVFTVGKSSTCLDTWHLMFQMLLAWIWLTSTCFFSALACCRLRYCWLPFAMGDDLDMNTEEVDAQVQMLEAFRGVASLVDSTLKLSPDPRHPKRRKDAPTSADGVAKEDKDLLPMVKLMAQLLLRHEQDLQCLHRVDTFILFCNREPTGLLNVMIHQTGQWKQQLEKPQLIRPPLRQHLFQAMLNDLLTKVTKISQCPKEDKLIQAMLKTGMLMEDYSWPFLKWDPAKRAMIRTSQQPISMKRMMEDLTELIEQGTNAQLVQRFHSLSPKSEAQVVPWRLQLNLRMDTAWNMLLHLTQNSVWSIQGANLKAHSQQESRQAQDLRALLQPSKGKSKGKGKKGS